MKFAVIEYTSKSGRIWQHTPDHPNYLANPQTELDPTSFGCYVSALGGQHIPLAGLILGPVNEVSTSQRWYRQVIKKFTGSWPQSYSLDYLADFDVLMIVHQITNGHEVTAFTKRLKQRYPHIFILGVPTHSYGILAKHWQSDPAWLSDFQEFMNTCDVFLTIVKATTSDWQKLTATPVVYLPQPYPVEYAHQYFSPLADKKPILFVAGVTGRPEIKKGQIVARELQKEFPEYLIQMTDISDLTLDVSELKGTRYEITPFTQWQEHLEYLRSVRLVINTDYTLTRGRVQVDCAAVGTPSLGADSDGQTDLFPTLASHPDTSVEELVALGRRLLIDDAYYQTTVQAAQAALAKYTYSLAADRIHELVHHYGQKVSR